MCNKWIVVARFCLDVKRAVEQLRLKMGYTSKVTQDHSAVHDEQLPYGGRTESNKIEWEIFDPREFSS